MYEAVREILMNARRRNLRELRQQDWLYLASCVTLTKKLYSYHVVGPLYKYYMYLMFLTGQCCEVLLNDCLVDADGPCTLQHKGVKILERCSMENILPVQTCPIS